MYPFAQDESSNINTTVTTFQVQQCNVSLNSHSLPAKDRRARQCTMPIDPSIQHSITVTCDLSSQEHGVESNPSEFESKRVELQSRISDIVHTSGIVSLDRVKQLTRKVTELWNESVSKTDSREYNISIFKKAPYDDGTIDVGDESKLACQLNDHQDPSFQLVKEIIGHLLPGYRIGEVEDVLTHARSAEAYVFKETGSKSDQDVHVDSAVELACGQEVADDCDNECDIHVANLRLYQKKRPPLTLWLSHHREGEAATGVAVYHASHHPVIAAYEFRESTYVHQLHAYLASQPGKTKESFTKHFMYSLAQHMKKKHPELASHPMEGRIIRPEHDGGLLVHGLLIHSGTGHKGYRVIAAADPQVRHCVSLCGYHVHLPVN